MVLTKAEIMAELGRIKEVLAKNKEQEKDWYEKKGINDMFYKIIANLGPPESEKEIRETEILKAEIVEKLNEEMRRIIEAKRVNAEDLRKIRNIIMGEDASSSSK
ncbi:uncharacterized protein LOC111829721 [Capsella rubella]|uniref:uncharacterized protein LOC111829721 n=1 Tax=Capsella rubella TaxID=81985 RepID=UPI000CD52297|nr:uncharacterized protein LOC111829721 [Capsella rubella]